MCQMLVVTQWPNYIFKNVKKIVYTVLRARRTIAVTRPLVLRMLLRDHAQAAGVWRTDAIKSYQPKHMASMYSIWNVTINKQFLYKFWCQNISEPGEL